MTGVLGRTTSISGGSSAIEGDGVRTGRGDADGVSDGVRTSCRSSNFSDSAARFSDSESLSPPEISTIIINNVKFNDFDKKL